MGSIFKYSKCKVHWNDQNKACIANTQGKDNSLKSTPQK